MNILALLAQVAEANPALFTYGPLGIITAWMMWRDEKRAIQMREVESRQFEYQADVMHRIDGLAKAFLVKMVKEEPKGSTVHEYAATAIAKIDAREARDLAAAKQKK